MSWRLPIFLSLFVLLCGAVAPCADYSKANRTTVEAHVVRALELAHEGKFENAEAELRQAVKLAPADPQVLATLGTILAMQQKMGESTEVFKKALQLNSNDLTTRRYLAANLWQLHRYREARDNLQIVLKQTPDDKPSRLLLGMVAENMEDYAMAARMLASVPDQVQKQRESIAALARAYYHLGQTSQAEATLTLLSSPSFGPEAVFLGAQIADEMGDFPTAESLFTSILDTFADRPRLEYSLALVAYHAGRIESGADILSQLVKSGTATASVFNLLGWCYQKQGRSEEALRALEQSIQLAPSEEISYLDLAKILLAQHALPAALRAATRATGTFPNSAAAYELRGVVEKEMGQFTDAVEAYAKSVRIEPLRPDPLVGLAQSQAAAGMIKEAKASFETGIRKFPKDARFKAEFGVMLVAQSEAGDATAEARASQLLRSALILDPALPAAHYQLGNLALKNNHIAEAQQHLEQATKLDPGNRQAHFALARVYRRLGRTDDAAHEMEVHDQLTKAGAETRN
jgi:tetratricopeptide (TPR) repeat protein